MIMHPHIKLSLTDQAMPVWRILSAPDTLLLTRFSHVINLCFGWPDTQVYEFAVEQSAVRFTDNIRHNLSGFKECHPSANVTILDLLMEQETIVYFYGSAPSYKIEISLNSFPRLQYQPMIQLIDSFGDNIPCQNGSYLPFHQQTVTQQLKALQTKMVAAYEEDNPTNILQLQNKLLKDGLWDNIINEFKEDLQLDDIPERILEIMLDGLGEGLGRSLSKTYTLHQCLLTLNKDELTNIARFHNLSGYGKLRKTELMDYLETALQKPLILENYFSKLTYPDIELLGTLCNYNVPIINYDNFLLMRYLISAGICYMNDTESAFTLPIEFRKAFQEILQSDTWQESVYLNDVVHSYCFTATYLYGIYPIAALIPNIEEMVESDLSLTLLTSTVKMLAEERKEYIYHSGFIKDILFANNDNSHSLYQHQQQMNDYSCPDDQTLDQIYWDKWIINQMLYDSFQTAFEEYYIGEEPDFQFFLRQLEFKIRSGTPFAILIRQLTEQKFLFPNKTKTEQFTAALKQIWNQTPIWNNCGYTPKQMSRKQKSKNNIVSLSNYRNQ